MNAKELRIGNLVQDIKYKTAWRINFFLGSQTVEIDHWIFDYETDDCHEPSMHKLEPIPLTEEWLKRFGFEFRKCGQDINSGRFCHWDYWICKGLILRGSKNRFGFNGDVKAIDIKSVHSLQNLYFALTGEELQAK